MPESYNDNKLSKYYSGSSIMISSQIITFMYPIPP
jgi:hypothetical protein